MSRMMSGLCIAALCCAIIALYGQSGITQETLLWEQPPAGSHWKSPEFDSSMNRNKWKVSEAIRAGGERITRHCCYMPDGEDLILGLDDGYVARYNINSRTIVWKQKVIDRGSNTPSDIGGVAASPRGDLIAVWCEYKIKDIFIVDAATGTTRKAISVEYDSAGNFAEWHSAFFGKDGNLYAIIETEVGKFYSSQSDPYAGKLNWRYNIQNPNDEGPAAKCNDFIVSLPRKQYISVNCLKRAKYVDFSGSARKLLGENALFQEAKEPQAILSGFSGNKYYVIHAGYGGGTGFTDIVEYPDMRPGKKLSYRYLVRMMCGFTGAAVSPDGKILAIGAPLCMWDTVTGKILHGDSTFGRNPRFNPKKRELLVNGDHPVLMHETSASGADLPSLRRALPAWK